MSKENLDEFFDLVKNSDEGYLIFVPKDGTLKPIVLGKKTNNDYKFKTFFNLEKEELNSLHELLDFFEKEYKLKEEKLIPRLAFCIIDSFAKKDEESAKVFHLNIFKPKIKGQ